MHAGSAWQEKSVLHYRLSNEVRSMSYLLKDVQQRAYDAVIAKYNEGVITQLISLPTGIGKTILALALSSIFQKTLFLVHRYELLDQTLNAYQYMFDDTKSASSLTYERDTDLVTGMIQTIYNGLEKLDPDLFDLVIIDEAHHAMAPTWRKTAEHFKSKLRLGLSATPERLDGAPLDTLFEEITFNYTLKEAIDNDYLSKPQYQAIPTTTYIDEVKTTAGDYSVSDLSRAINTPIRNTLIAAELQEHAYDRKILAFCVDIEHSETLASIINENTDISASYVHSQDPDRNEKVKQLKYGDLNLLTNPMILTEGYDEPSIDCIALCRPTQSKVLYTQMIGRDLRKFEGKSDCLILDFCDLHRTHRLNTKWKFKSGVLRPVALNDIVGEEETKEPTFSVDRLNEGVESARRPRRDFYEVYDPNIFDDLQDLDTFIDILNLPPAEELLVTEKSYGTKAWHYIPASSRQLEILRDNGYDVIDVDYSRGQASILIDRIFNKPPSEKQLRLGLAYGANPLANWTSRSISAYINKAKEAYKFNPLLYRLYDFIMEYASQIDELPLASS